MRRRLIFSLVLAVVWIKSNAQDIPVDPHTGKLQFTVPVWQINEGDISISLTAFYNGGGVRVEESEGSAGMGWSLQTGAGAVTRQLMALPDDYNGTGEDLRKGWLFGNIAQTINNFSPGGDDNLTTCADETNDFLFLEARGYTDDTEPDIFWVHGPGLSASFVFGTDGLPKSITHEDLKIEVIQSTNGSIQQFKITNNLGIVYVFSALEVSTRHAEKPATWIASSFITDYKYYTSPLTYTSSWLLTSISSPTGNNVSYNYGTLEESQSNQKIQVVTESGAMNTLYYLKNIVIPRQLLTISASSATIAFQWEETRISSVRISDITGVSTKSIDFRYVYAKDFRDTNPGARRRAWLRRVTSNTDCTPFSSYEFTYAGMSGIPADNASYTTTLPLKDENLQDLWGYYNGTSTTKIPDVYVYSGSSDAERYRIAQKPGQTPSMILDGASRVVNPSTVADGSLTAISYPTGGTALIYYEPNSYFDESANASFYGGGIRVKQVIIGGGEKGSDNIVFNYEYQTATGESSGRLTYRPVFAFADGTSILRTLDNLAPENELLYSNFTVKQAGYGKTTYEFDIPGRYLSTSFNDWNATKTRVARQYPAQEPGAPPDPCPDIGNLHTGYYTFPFAPNTNLDFERGLLSRVAEYAEGENGRLVFEKTYTHQYLTPGTVQIKGLKFERFNNAFVYGLYTIKANLDKVVLTETTRKADELNPSNMLETSVTYNYNPAHQLLESVTTTNSDGVIHKTAYKYAKDFSGLTNPDPAKPEAVAMKKLNDTFSHGETVEVIESTINGTTELVTGASLTLYKDFGANRNLPYKEFAFPPTQGFTPLTISTGSGGQYLQFDPDYRNLITYLSYNDRGFAESVTDFRKRKSAIHYSLYGTTPVASIGNALAQEVVYTDFEMNTGHSLVKIAGTHTVVAGWTGKSAYAIGASTVLQKEGVQKGANGYRYSCWMKSANTADVTFKVKNGAAVVVSAIAPYTIPDLNKWTYYEGLIDIDAAPATFTLEVTATGNIEIDDIRFLPADAVIATNTYDPLKGLTSVTDNRGVSAFTEYDNSGRVRYEKDRSKNIVKVFDYRSKKEAVPAVKSGFSSSVSNNQMKVGMPVTFTAHAAETSSCLTGLTYEWKIDGTVVGTSSNLVHTFQNSGDRRVELRVESPEYGYAVSRRDYCVNPATLSFNVQITDLNGVSQPDKIFRCAGNYQKRFTAQFQSGGCGSTNFYYIWEYKRWEDTTWTAITNGSSNTVDLSITTTTGYFVRCRIQQDDCSFTSTCSTSAINIFQTTISYVHEEHCP